MDQSSTLNTGYFEAKGATRTLVTFGAPKFKVRQWLLGGSARACGVVDQHRAWGPRTAERSAGLEGKNPMSFSERGAGYWWWKGFVVRHALENAKDGDIICYSDVGRGDSVKLLRLSLDPILAWMKEHNQPCMPGIQIPWYGTKKNWTKREAFVRKDADRADVWDSPPVQSTFTIWIKTPETLEFARQWAADCMDRGLISDDKSQCDEPDFSEFDTHMCDQSLLGLNLIKKDWKLLNFENEIRPKFNDKDLELWLSFLSEDSPSGIAANFFGKMASIYLFLENRLRRI